MMGRQIAFLPAMETDVLDAKLHREAALRQHSNGLPTTVGNACALSLAKLGVRQVHTPLL